MNGQLCLLLLRSHCSISHISMSKKLNLFGLTTILLVCICYASGFTQLNNVNDVRNKIFYSEFDLEKSITLLSEINALNLTSPIVKAYIGATEMLAAKYSWNPINKISFLKNGLKKVNEAVGVDIENIEIRFLRFYIENSLPKYLGLSDHLSEDKKIIIEHLENLSSLGLTKDIALFINKYMADSGQCSPEELNQVNQSITSLQFEGS